MNNRTLRLMLGFSEWMPASSYGLQTIVDNVGLLTEAVLEKINAVVVACGHERLKHGCDVWFVAELRTDLCGTQDPRVAQVQGLESKSIPCLPSGAHKRS